MKNIKYQSKEISCYSSCALSTIFFSLVVFWFSFICMNDVIVCVCMCTVYSTYMADHFGIDKLTISSSNSSDISKKKKSKRKIKITTTTLAREQTNERKRRTEMRRREKCINRMNKILQ